MIERTRPRTARIGVFGVGLNAYWGQFPGLLDNLMGFHARFKAYMSGYKGVATKYLNNYVGLFVWMENYRQAARGEEVEATSTVLEFGSYTPTRSFSTWEHEPALAPVA